MTDMDWNEYMRQYRQRPYVKEKRRQYQSLYRQRVEVKQKQRERMKEYYQRNGKFGSVESRKALLQ